MSEKRIQSYVSLALFAGALLAIGLTDGNLWMIGAAFGLGIFAYLGAIQEVR